MMLFASCDKIVERSTTQRRGGYFSGATFRLRADNGLETVYSDTADVEYTDVGQIRIVAIQQPPDLIAEGEGFQIELEVEGTAYGRFHWQIYDPFGNWEGTVPPRWTWSEETDNLLTVFNGPLSVHGYVVEPVFHAQYYVAGADGPEHRGASIGGPSWTLQADSRALLASQLAYDYAPEAGTLTLKADWSALVPPEIEWQVSVDGGVRWHTFATTQGEPFHFKAAGLLGQGALFRAKVAQAGSAPTVTDPLDVRRDQPRLVERGQVQVLSIDLGGSFALHDRSIAVTGTDHLRIHDWQGDEWGEATEVAVPGVFVGAEVQFASSGRLLVRRIHSTDDAPWCGSLAEVTRDAGGQWSVRQIILPPEPCESGAFGHKIAVSEDLLLVTDGTHDRSLPVRVLFYRLIDDRFRLVQQQQLDQSGGGSWALGIAHHGAHLSGGSATYFFSPQENHQWALQSKAPPGYIYSGPNWNTARHSYVLPKGSALREIDQWAVGTDGTAERVRSFQFPLGALHYERFRETFVSNREWTAVLAQDDYSGNALDRILFLKETLGGKRSP